ncbi:3-isopropylmalate dehydratase small subunit [Acrocarpospora pleiomorpha]|uniref:3-isopropylmalate dehydratase small subunit n=1 Tax=Acrocarpospora pleiomorpha TaxID=90975 RepID=A0A5M3XYT9_9ACTN|nr:3-isopropylmalate dehydratase [Acrocarpospora pleiomorpha]GES24711.1 3-isopropylmalate dehydratase small subunit [Acrocarpospora pleiomorpha]
MRGKVWLFGDDINTDLLQPADAAFLPLEEQPRWCMSPNRPGWSDLVQPGDVLVAGRNFGTGSSRPAARVLKHLGLGCLLADSINGLFFRNCVNYAFPALEVPGVSGLFTEGDVAEIDFAAARVTNVSSGERLPGITWPEPLQKILEAGGLIPLLVAEGLVEPQ